MSERAAPHSRTKAERRVLSPDEQWAAEIRDRIIADCHPFQRDAVLDPSRRVSLLAGRGGAKTTTMRARAGIKVTSIRRAEILYLATTKPHAKKLYWDKLQDMNELYGMELRFRDSDLTATCAKTGGRIEMSGMEDAADIRRYRGYPFDEVQVDEGSLHDRKLLESLLFEVIGPRLGERNGCIVIGGTAGHELKGEFYDATRPGSSRQTPYADRDKPDYEPRYWSSHYWTAEMVCALPNARALYPAIVANWEEQLKEKEEQQWSDEHPIWLRESKAQWASDDTNMVFQYKPFATDGTTPWNQWDPFDDHKLEGVQALEAAIAKLRDMGLRDLRFVYSGDMGSTLPYALNVFAFSPKDPQRRIWHVMPFERTRMHARPIAELHLGPEATERVFRGGQVEPLGGAMGLTGWPDGMIMDTDGATLDELRNTYAISYKKAERNPHYKRGAIALVNGELLDGRIKIIKGSPLEDQITSLQWRENSHGHVEEDPRQASHSTDCLVYGRKLIAGLFDSGAVEQEAKPEPGGPPQLPAPAPPPPPDPGIASDPLRVPLHFTDPWGNL